MKRDHAIRVANWTIKNMSGRERTMFIFDRMVDELLAEMDSESLARRYGEVLKLEMAARDREEPK